MHPSPKQDLPINLSCFSARSLLLLPCIHVARIGFLRLLGLLEIDLDGDKGMLLRGETYDISIRPDHPASSTKISRFPCSIRSVGRQAESPSKYGCRTSPHDPFLSRRLFCRTGNGDEMNACLPIPSRMFQGPEIGANQHPQLHLSLRDRDKIS